MLERLNVRGLVRFEGVLALVLVVVPLALLAVDTRDSISSYHDIDDPRWFFVPLTAAAMMLMTNGLVQSHRHGYNAALGALLLGVVMFDHDGGSQYVHFACAVPFFVIALAGTALMFTHYRRKPGTSGPSRGVAIMVALAIVAILGVVALIANRPTFWVESVGVWIIAVHHLLHARWEAAHPDDETEPGDVLRSLWPGLHRVLTCLISPISYFWHRFNKSRAAVA